MSEEVVGSLLNSLLPRDEYVLATKISMPMGAGANQSGLSRKHVMEGIDACLKRSRLYRPPSYPSPSAWSPRPS